jgi:uncharacterized protein
VTEQNHQALHLQWARDSIAATLKQYNQCREAAADRLGGAALKHQLDQSLVPLATTLDKLDRRVVRIAVFGLVSRGKSAVLNALVGEALLETGPLHGVTQQIKVVEWSPTGSPATGSPATGSPATGSPATGSPATGSETAAVIELFDTPGLDEVDGATRAQMAADVTAQCDLILFVVAGAITAVEYAALCDLRSAQKPLILVFNKIDLYPEQTRASIDADLLRWNQQAIADSQREQLLTADAVVLVAADPAAQQVRVEHPDGRVEFVWEKPPVQIAALQQRILTLLQQEGRSLLALNALRQSEQAATVMAAAVIEHRAVEAEALILRFAQVKAISVGLNPLGFLDFVGGAIGDLSLIRELAKLYGLPMTRYAAGSLLKAVLLSSGGLLATELLGWLLLADGNLAGWLAIGVLQAGVAGYGAYQVGRSTQVDLAQGCNWGAGGASTVIEAIVATQDSHQGPFKDGDLGDGAEAGADMRTAETA